MTQLEYIEHCRLELRSAIAPLTAPDPSEAARIEAAIDKLIQAKVSLAIRNAPFSSHLSSGW